MSFGNTGIDAVNAPVPSVVTATCPRPGRHVSVTGTPAGNPVARTRVAWPSGAVGGLKSRAGIVPRPASCATSSPSGPRAVTAPVAGSGAVGTNATGRAQDWPRCTTGHAPLTVNGPVGTTSVTSSGPGPMFLLIDSGSVEPEGAEGSAAPGRLTYVRRVDPAWRSS